MLSGKTSILWPDLAASPFITNQVGRLSGIQSIDIPKSDGSLFYPLVNPLFLWKDYPIYIILKPPSSDDNLGYPHDLGNLHIPIASNLPPSHRAVRPKSWGYPLIHFNRIFQ